MILVTTIITAVHPTNETLDSMHTTWFTLRYIWLSTLREQEHSDSAGLLGGGGSLPHIAQIRNLVSQFTPKIQSIVPCMIGELC